MISSLLVMTCKIFTSSLCIHGVFLFVRHTCMKNNIMNKYLKKYRIYFLSISASIINSRDQNLINSQEI